MTKAVLDLYDEIVNPALLIRRITIGLNHVITSKQAEKKQKYEQLSFFSDTSQICAQREELEKERHIQEAMLSIKRRYGKNAVLKGTNFKDGATMRERNGQIGGHKA